MKKIFEKNVNGTRDLFGKNFYQHEYILDTIKKIYKLHGFIPLETPIFEHLSTLSSIYGEENSKLIYKILNSGDFLKDVEIENENHISLSNKICKKALRYDLTVPLMRFISNNLNEITFPFKRYQIQPVFRADRPQKGRFREFYQCDADIIGSESLFCEIEILSIITEVFEKLKIKNFKIKINDKKILNDLAKSLNVADENFNSFCTILDKLDKTKFENIISDLQVIGIKEKEILILKNILEQQGNNKCRLNFISKYFSEKNISNESIESLNFIFENSSEEILEKIEIDFSLARGLGYYTGIIFEVKIENLEIGSVAGGGRYHKFAEIYENPNLKALGFSFGIDRLVLVLNELNLFPKAEENMTKILVIDNFSNDKKFLNSLIKNLREKVGPAEFFLGENMQLKKQLNYANKIKIPFIVIVNEKDLVVKNMLSGEEKKFEKINFENIFEFLY